MNKVLGRLERNIEDEKLNCPNNRGTTANVKHVGCKTGRAPEKSV